MTPQSISQTLFYLISTTMALFMIYLAVEASLSRLPRGMWRSVVLTAVYSALAVLVLSAGVQVEPGVWVDTRNGVLVAATVSLGARSGLVVASAAILARLWMSGSGAALGSLSMLCAWAATVSIDLLYRRLVPERRARSSLVVILLAAVAGGLMSLAAMSWMVSQGRLHASTELIMIAALAQAVSAVVLWVAIQLTESRTTALRERRLANEALRRSLHQAIGSLAQACLHRDPAVSVHQRRVAHLAVVLGRRLGFTEDALEGLELAALIHDIGQIEVPGEILSRPGPLTAAEFELIKQHPAMGYEILKDIEFPWPLAEIIYQHHENLDGSGYPRGLSGEQICKEARILRVCDTVEAMCSHRVFRTPLGVDKALQEIERMAGRKLDAEVVVACLAVFREEGYQFPVY